MGTRAVEDPDDRAAQIARSVASAPTPSPELLEKLALIFAPAVERVRVERARAAGPIKRRST